MVMLHDFIKWVKYCCELSFFVTLLLFFIVSLVIFGLFRGIYLYWSKVYSGIMFVMMGSSWFTDKSLSNSGDVKSVNDGQSSGNKGDVSVSDSHNSLGESKVGGVVGKEDFGKVMDVGSLSDVLKEAVKEAIKEAMKDLVVKEAKKKKDKVVGGDSTLPKKSSKKVLAGETSGVVVELGNQEVAPVKKKKSKKSEPVIKEVFPDK
uniref:M-ORF n=1 Tax=Unio tumidus TaxID=143298 RepID=A0A1Q1MMR9_9BIVA|nr:M-ORF [Unio tumidus]